MENFIIDASRGRTPDALSLHSSALPANFSFLVKMSVEVPAIIRITRRVSAGRPPVKSLRFPSHSCHYAPTRWFTRFPEPTHQTRLPKTPISSHPYTFHIGTSCAAKPDDPLVLRSRSPFPSDTIIGTWRDRTLARKKKDPGEDFFFVQQVTTFFSFTSFYLIHR